MKYFLTVVAIFLGEFFIKETAQRNEHIKDKQLILGNRIFLWRHHNYGAFLNFGDDSPKVIRGTSVILTIMCFFGFLKSMLKRGREIEKLGWTLLLGGALSNTYDRIARKYVVDYFGFEIVNTKLGQIVFNLSDFFIMIGAFVVAICSKPKARK